MSFLHNRFARILTIALLLQAGAFYAVAFRAERTPDVPPLTVFPSHIGNWQMVQDFPIEPEIQEILRADDTMNRVYASAGKPAPLYLFLAYFKTQRKGQAPHSPKNCLPGAGWEPVEDARIDVTVPGREAPIRINRYVVVHGEEKSVTLYWYQSHGRVIASEFSAKFWLVADAVRYRRSDTSLVRISVPVFRGDVDAASQTAVEFVQAVYPSLLVQLPL